MEAATWSALGILSGAFLGTLFYLGNQIGSLGNRIDGLSNRIDGLASRIDAHVDRHV